MKKFEQAVNEAKKSCMTKELQRIDNERKILLEAICFNEGVGDKSNLKTAPEKKRAHIASLVREMWSSERGLNAVGRKYLFENEYTLSEKSSNESIKNYIISEVKGNISEWMSAFYKDELSEKSETLAKEISALTKKEIKNDAVAQVIRGIFDEIVRARLSPKKG